MEMHLLQQAYDKIRAKWPEAKPKAGLVLGSGWSDVVDSFEIKDTMAYEDIPGLGKPGVIGHSGQLAWAEAGGVETFIFQGRRHFYEGKGWTPCALPIYVLKQMGVTVVTLTNAAGVMKDGMKPGDQMIIDDHINNFGTNPLIGEAHEVWGARFPDQSEVYSKELRDLLDQAAANTGRTVHHGVYLASSGPPYETPAEVRRYKQAGADAVGMSTVPEALLASASGMKVAGISCATNFAAGISPHPLTHKEVTDATAEAMPRMKSLLAEYWNLLGSVV